jgi:hypothetical protein
MLNEYLLLLRRPPMQNNFEFKLGSIELPVKGIKLTDISISGTTDISVIELAENFRQLMELGRSFQAASKAVREELVEWANTVHSIDLENSKESHRRTLLEKNQDAEEEILSMRLANESAKRTFLDRKDLDKFYEDNKTSS